MKPSQVFGLVFLVSLASNSNSQDWPRECRNVPLPAAASPALQAAIRDYPKGDLSVAPDIPATDAEWVATVEAVDTEMGSLVPEMLEQFRVTIKQGKVAGVEVHHISPDYVSRENKGRLFLYLHGGAYVFGSGEASLGEAIVISDRVDISVLSVDYRMPPNHPFPAALNDVVAVYRELIESRPATSIIIGGTSSGGGLALATVHKLIDLGLPVPGAIYAGTPWSDLTKTGDTLFTNECLDRVLFTYDGVLGAAARLYAARHDLKDPLISPVYGDFAGFPPTILASGTRDMFLSDVSRTHRKLRAEGIVAELHVYEGMSHAGYVISPHTPESENLYVEIRHFINNYVD